MRKAPLRLLTLSGLVTATVIAGASGALASCHRFDLAVSDQRVFEGDTLTVTVSRVGASAASSVLVSTVADSATPADYSSVEQRLSFAGSEAQMSLDVEIVDDAEQEATESFLIRLSAPQGCADGPGFDLPPDATVTIIASDLTPAEPDQSPTPEPEPEPTPEEPTEPEPAPEASPEPEPTPDESPEAEPSPSPIPEETDEPAGPEEDDDEPEPQATDEQEIPTVPGWVFLGLGAAILLTAWFVYTQLGRDQGPPEA